MLPTDPQPCSDEPLIDRQDLTMRCGANAGRPDAGFPPLSLGPTLYGAGQIATGRDAKG